MPDLPSSFSSPSTSDAAPFLTRRVLLTSLLGSTLGASGLLALRQGRSSAVSTAAHRPIRTPFHTPTPAEWMEQAQTAYDRAEYREAERCASLALRTFRQGGYAEGIATALGTRGQALQALGEFRQAGACYQEALGVREHQRHLAGQAHMLEMLSGLAQHAGHDEEADWLLVRCETLRQGLGDTVGVALCARDRGILASEQGHYAEAEAQYARCLRLIHARQKPEIEAHVQALRGAMRRDQGQLPQARTLLSDSLRFWQQQGHPRWIAGMKRHLGLVALYAGELTEAEKQLRESVAGYTAVGDTYATAETQLWLARTRHRQGHAGEALLLLSRSTPILHEQGARLAVVRSREVAAELKAAAEPETALSLLAQAAAERTKMACPLPPVERKRQANLLQFLRTTRRLDRFATMAPQDRGAL